MTQADGNRARFFSRGQDFNPSVVPNPNLEKSLSVLPTVSGIAATSHALVTSALSQTNYNDGDDIVAQRTRMIETETLFKPKKDRHGKLNLSGLMKESKKTRGDPGIMPSATITEIESSEIPQNFNISFPNNAGAGNNSLTVKPRTLNTQATAFIPSNLNNLAVSDITVETPINKRPLNVKEPSRGDQLDSTEAPVLSGNQRNPFHQSDFTLASSRAVIGTKRTKNDFLGTTINKATDETQDEQQFVLMPSYNDIEHARNPDLLTEPGGHSVHRNGEKRKPDTAVAQLPDSACPKKRKKNNGFDRAYEPNFQSHSSPESYVSRSIDEKDVITSAHPPSSNSFIAIMGRDIENYLTSHLDEYERAKARWADCSREEWVQGATEIAAQFTKILDFVKEHMRRKIMLYANLQANLDDHHSVRDSIANMLKEAKNELVAKTGVLIDEGRSN